MAVDKEKKQAYNEEIGQLKQKVEEIKKKIAVFEAQREDKNLNNIRASSLYIDLITIYCAMTDLSLSLLGYKNETYLDIGRKSLYKAIITLEGIVSNFIDMPLGENYEILQELKAFSDEERSWIPMVKPKFGKFILGNIGIIYGTLMISLIFLGVDSDM